MGVRLPHSRPSLVVTNSSNARLLARIRNWGACGLLRTPWVNPHIGGTEMLHYTLEFPRASLDSTNDFKAVQGCCTAIAKGLVVRDAHTMREPLSPKRVGGGLVNKRGRAWSTDAPPP